MGSIHQEASLVEAARRGSTGAFRKLLELHQGRLRAYLRRYVRDRDAVDDLAQESFLAIFRDLASYTGQAPFGSWVLRIAKHRALSYLRDEARRRAREARAFEGALAEALAERADPEDATPGGIDAELAALRACMEKLPSHSAKLISRYYFRKNAATAIAEELGLKRSAVSVALFRIRQRLRECVLKALSTTETP